MRRIANALSVRRIGWLLTGVVIVGLLVILMRGTGDAGSTAATLTPVLEVFGSFVLIVMIWIVLWFAGAFGTVCVATKSAPPSSAS